jgi:exosortase
MSVIDPSVPLAPPTPPPPASSTERQGWTLGRAAAAVVITLLGILVGIEAWADIKHLAMRDEEASHVFLVPFVVVWLVWVRRHRLRHIRPAGFWIGPSTVLLGWILLSLGERQLWQSIWHLGAILIAVGCLLTALGRTVLRAFLPAFLVLVFLIPVPGRVRQRIAIPMQNATAQITQDMLSLANIPVERSGNLLQINGVDVAVAEACNGLRMVFALSLVCFAFAFGNPLRPYARILILVATPFAAILCNVVRLVLTVYVYGNYPPETAERFHDISGWIMLFVAFLSLMGILRLLRWALIPVNQFNLAYD